MQIVGPFIPLIRVNQQNDTIADESKYMDIKGGTTRIKFEVEPFLNVEWVGEPTVSMGKITCSFKVTRGVSPEIFKSKIEPMGGYDDNFLDVTSIVLFVGESPYAGYAEGLGTYHRLIEFPSAASDNKSFEDFYGFDETITVTSDGVIWGGHTVFVRVGARIRYYTEGVSRYNYNEAKRIDVKHSVKVTPNDRNILFAANGQFALADGKTITPTFTVDNKGKAWDAVSDYSWLTVSKQDNTFTLSAAGNTGSPRDATITITVEGEEPAQITVNQIGTGNITNLVLKNTESPFAITGEQIGDCWLAADWTGNQAATQTGNVRLGANSWDPQYDLGFNGWWGHVTNAKLYQTVELEAGTYRYEVTGVLGNGDGSFKYYITAALGDDLPDVDNVEQDALGFALLPENIDRGTPYSFEFVLSQKSTVSLGFAVTYGAAQAYFSKVELWKDQ